MNRIVVEPKIETVMRFELFKIFTSDNSLSSTSTTIAADFDPWVPAPCNSRIAFGNWWE